MLNRRRIIEYGLLGTAAAALPGCLRPGRAPAGIAAPGVGLIDDVAERTFQFFWQTTNPDNGLAPDRYPSPSFASIAAVGFALTAYPIGVERGWVSRAAAAARTLTTLRFFWNAPQGEAQTGITGYKGFFYHFLDMRTGHRYKNTELSTIDTALLLGGVLFAGEYFDRDLPEEAEIRALAHQLYARVEWPWFAPKAPVLSMGWHPGQGFNRTNWVGYNEGMLLCILAMGSPTHPLPAATWQGWTAGYHKDWADLYGHRLLGFAPMFGHQYSHVWIDFRGIRDAPMARAGFDYFENSRRAALVQQAYAIANPMGWADYGENIWGLTACDGPGGGMLAYRGEKRRFWFYHARGASGADVRDDGTIAPTAALGSIAFVPEQARAAAAAMVARYGDRLYGDYGFRDSFNPSYKARDRAMSHSRVYDDIGWIDSDYLGIDQGPIIAMIENERTGMVWNYMRRNRAIQTGLKRAGFTGGWIDRA